MRKKIGILTFHRSSSYGGVLQAFALQNFLRKHNVENEIVDYHSDFMNRKYERVFREISGNKIKGFLWNIYTAKYIVQRKKQFNKFVKKHLVISKPYDKNNIKFAKNEYSEFITGSDQVFSSDCAGFDGVYFLTFANSSQKFSYSGSLGTEFIKEDKKQEYINRLQDFQKISVREKSSKVLLEKLLKKQVDVHIDPTLLLDKKFWDNFAQCDAPKEKYIFVYTVLKPKKLLDYALKLSKETGLKILFLNNQSFKKVKGVTYLSPCSVEMFLSYIKNAEYVLTNSFHGTAFSVVFEKKFLIEEENAFNKNNRAFEFLKDISLENRVLENNIEDEILWNKINAILDEKREESKRYLLSI